MQPPSSFLQAMEEYVKDAPQGSVHKDQVWMNINNSYVLVFVALCYGCNRKEQVYI